MLTLTLLVFGISRVVISEVMANPAGGSGVLFPEDRNEFIELYNPTGHAVDLLDWTLDDGDARDLICPWTDSTLLETSPGVLIGQTWLPPGSWAVVLDPEYTSPAAQGGFVRPYWFPDSTLIVSVRNTTIGNGLAGSDPVWLISPYGDTSTFGTPLDPADSLPRDAGDGRSWERIDPAGPDTPGNWVVCIDSAGATPGRAASLLQVDDLAITSLLLADSGPLRPGGTATVRVELANHGRRATERWRLTVWLDRNGNSSPEPGEIIGGTDGFPLEPGADTSLLFRFVCPERTSDLWAEVSAPAEFRPADNRRRLTVRPGLGGLLDLSRDRFTPNGDGFEDSLELLYRLEPTGGRLRLIICDLRGKELIRLIDRRASEADGFCTWDGRSSDGRPLPGGIYAAVLHYTVGGRSFSARRPFVLSR